MSEQNFETHPLDRDETEDATSGKQLVIGTARAHQPLLRASVKAVVASFVWVFLAGIAANVAPPNSHLESIASIAHRFGMIAMLVAFCAVLSAYRIPQIRRMRESIARDRMGLPLAQNHFFKLSFATLVILNILGVSLAWGFIFLFSMISGPMVIVVLAMASTVFAGLLATMAIWHTGFLRAYAVGALTVLVLLSSNSFILYMAWTMGASRGRIGAWPIALLLTIAPLTGVLCAGYVSLLENLRKDQQSGSVRN